VPRYVTNQAFSGALIDHPAVHAWSELVGERKEPDSIRILKERRKGKRGKSGVYLLEGVGPSDSDVVAKRLKKYKGLLESTIYSDILPRLPVSGLGYYGLLDEENTKYCWLFLENAVGKPFLPNDPDHRAAAGRWLGMMHTSAVHIDEVADLPDRGPNHYRNHLKAAYEHIHPYISNPSMDAEGKSTLMKIMANLDFLETHWQELAGSCNGLPNTFVHGDFGKQNIRFQKNHDADRLLVFDWEYVGWGTPVVDLAKSPGSSMQISANPAIGTYLETVRDQWPDLDFYTLERMAYVGTLFRVLAVINWATMELSHEWFLKPMSYLTIYEARLSHEIRSGKWRL
jgi:hypothetical protein